MVALPVRLEAVADPASRRWLAKGRLRRSGGSAELLERVLSALDLPPSDGGIAALRLWGQTGERPDSPIAAADPVYLEPRLDRVCVHALSEGELPPDDVRAVFELLQVTLGSNGSGQPYEFTSIGATGYLRSEPPIATADVSPEIADGASPDLFLPEGETARSHDRLESEVQMCLHESAVNRRREAAGARPVNALWFWGGGMAPPAVERDLPVLFADDPVLRGYWRSSSSRVEAWPGSLGACLDAVAGRVVAVAPACGDPARHLADLRALLSEKKLRRAVLLFRDGSRVDLRTADRFRFWRRGFEGQ